MSAAKVAVSKKSEHPTYREMISAAIVNLKERNGSSRQAIKKYIHANFKVCLWIVIEEGIIINKLKYLSRELTKSFIFSYFKSSNVE